MPDTVGFQADQAHTYLYLLGYNAEEHALLKPGYSHAEFDAAYTKMTDALRPWTIDFHVAQNDGTVHGTGAHEKTGRHCPADDPNGKLDIVKTAGYWLKDAKARGLHHICWDGCMFPNAMLEAPANLEHHPRHDDQSPRRPRLELKWIASDAGGDDSADPATRSTGLQPCARSLGSEVSAAH